MQEDLPSEFGPDRLAVEENEHANRRANEHGISIPKYHCFYSAMLMGSLEGRTHVTGP